MKIIFLDIDGVLNYAKCPDKLPNSNIYFVSDKKIKLLKKIIEKTGAKIVLSSTWRIGWTMEEKGAKPDTDFHLLKDKLLEYGVELFSKTPLLSDTRGKEIEQWLYQRKNETIESFIILDDDNDMFPYENRLVQTSFTKGLTQKQVSKAIKLLNTKEY